MDFKTSPNLKEDVLIIDYGVGNILSITNALEVLGYTFKTSNKKEDIVTAQALILPGVGAFSEAMKNLNQLDIIKTLQEQVLTHKKPILGICLGMQILAEDSNENGIHKGLRFIKGSHVIKIESQNEDLIPHVGWNNVSVTIKDPLFTILEKEPHFYFDHSYHFICDQEIIAASCYYAGQKITAAIQYGNIFGVQPHPEKSQNNGLRMYRSFFNYIKKIKQNNHNNNELEDIKC